MENYFYFVNPGAVADPEEEGGGKALLHASPPEAPAREYHLGYQPGTLFGLGRVTPKGLILSSYGPFFVCQETVFTAQGPIRLHKAYLMPKSETKYFPWVIFSFRRPS